MHPRLLPALAPPGVLRVVLALGLTGAALCAEPPRNRAEVAINADLTAEGEKYPRPTPDRPAYYVPVILGWHEGGKIVAGEEPPKRELVLKQLGQALAKEGYVLQALRPDANKTLPSLIIAVEWGYLNPLVSDHGALDLSTGDGGSMAPAEIRNDPTQTGVSDFNQSEMVALVAGPAFAARLAATGSLGLTQRDWERLRDAVAEDRYFVIVSAYDFEASVKGEQRLLWRARMSTARHKVWMDDVLPALVAAGAPLFGRQTEAPAWKEYPVREGRVVLGDLKVLESEVKLPAKTAPESESK